MLEQNFSMKRFGPSIGKLRREAEEGEGKLEWIAIGTGDKVE